MNVVQCLSLEQENKNNQRRAFSMPYKIDLWLGEQT